MSDPAPTAAPTPTLPNRLHRMSQSRLTRLLMLGVLMLVLMIPAAMLREVINERAERRAEASHHITNSWGGEQTLGPPILRVPYTVARQIKTPNETQTVVVTEYLLVLPESAQTQASLAVETRKLGMFSVPVYRVSFAVQGALGLPDVSHHAGSPLRWQDAELIMPISDARGISADASLKVGDSNLALSPLSQGWLRAAYPLTEAPTTMPRYRLHYQLSGADRLSILPLGKDNQITIRGNWPHPRFTGAWLPAQRTVGNTGFSGTWTVSHLGRSLAQQVTSADTLEVRELQSIDVSLSQPVDDYSMAERIAKYASITLLFTFMTLWLLEVLGGKRLHAIQYLLLGAALCLFGLLQLSIAEHTGFNTAFAASAAAVVGLVALYSYSALQSMARAATITGILSGLYGYLYLLLQAEDHALLGGSLALFVGLAAVMWLTRKVDWGESPSQPNPKWLRP